MKSWTVVKAGPEALPDEEGDEKKEKMEAGRASPSSCCLFGSPTKPGFL